MTLQIGPRDDGKSTPQEARQAYTAPSIRSGLAFEPVLAATDCNENDPEDTDCAGSPPGCFE